MKIIFDKIKHLTIASLITIVIYIATYWITSALMNEFPKSMYILAIIVYSIVLMGVFNLIFIRRIYVKNSTGENIASCDFKDGYWGLKHDIAEMFKRELSTLSALAIINITTWFLISMDKLIFSKRTITAILLIYAPLNVIGVALPSWANSILGYLLGTILCFAIYLLELVIYRKRLYVYWNKSKR